MSLVCTIVMGVLCIHAPVGGATTATFDDGGIWIKESVVFAGSFSPVKSWKISTGRSMEWAPAHIDGGKLSQACVDGVCRTYWRNCDDAVHPKSCSFTIDEGNGVARTFVVEAPDETQLGDALANAGVVAGANRTPIPFAAMNREAPSTDVPYLKPEGPQPN